MTVLCIAPLQEEFEFFMQSLQERGYTTEEVIIGRLVAQHVSTLQMIVSRGGHGKTQFGIQTQHLLDHLHDVDAVVCFGAAGALASTLRVGDVVVATETMEHDYTLRFVSRPLPRFAGDPVLLAGLRQLSLTSFPFEVQFGIVASGDEDIIEVERATAVQQTTEACAVAWEGAGGGRACRFSNVPFIEIRGVTDTANRDAPADFETNLHAAMQNVADLIVRWRTT